MVGPYTIMPYLNHYCNVFDTIIPHNDPIYDD